MSNVKRGAMAGVLLTLAGILLYWLQFDSLSRTRWATGNHTRVINSMPASGFEDVDASYVQTVWRHNLGPYLASVEKGERVVSICPVDFLCTRYMVVVRFEQPQYAIEKP